MKKRLLLPLILAIMLLSVACGNKDEGEAPSPTVSAPTSEVQATTAPSEIPDSDPTVAPTATEVPVITEIEEELPTATPVITESEQPTPTPVAEASPTEIPPTPTPTVRDTTAERDEYWELTYLIWLPRFTDGVFNAKSSDDTFDYAEFTDVDAGDVTNYIETLKNAGFTNIKTDNSGNDVIEYAATNDDDWMVRLKFSDGVLTIGSGFIDEEAPSSEEEARKKVWSSTALQYLPEFTKGTFVSSSTETNDMTYTYAFFDGVSEADVREYVEELKTAGYVYGPEEGDSDGIIWYMAINDDRLNCYLAYDNSLVKIGCGYED